MVCGALLLTGITVTGADSANICVLDAVEIKLVRTERQLRDSVETNLTQTLLAKPQVILGKSEPVSVIFNPLEEENCTMRSKPITTPAGSSDSMPRLKGTLQRQNTNTPNTVRFNLKTELQLCGRTVQCDTVLELKEGETVSLVMDQKISETQQEDRTFIMSSLPLIWDWFTDTWCERIEERHIIELTYKKVVPETVTF